MKRGKFVTFEGCEGVGKSTQLKFLKEYAEQNGIEIIFTREPGGTSVSEQIRNVILDVNNTSMVAECESLLYAAARAQLIKEIILPALEAGKTVVCDRYIDSSFAYQAYGRNLGFELVARFNSYALSDCMPDVTILLDMRPEDNFRKKKGKIIDDRMENESLEFHDKVYDGFTAIADKFPERIVKIKPTGDKLLTHRLVIEALKTRGIL